MKKKSIDVVNQLQRYFGAKIIGSQLLVQEGLLTESMTNDIDIAAIKSTYNYISIKKFLEDQGFTGKEITINSGSYVNNSIARVIFTNNEYDKEIDINFFKSTPTIYTIPELIKAKFQKGTKKDLEQLFEVILNKGKSDMEDLSKIYEVYKIK